ncbi:hypothetical protein NRIC_00490 [Enterococcus florum]|uniref:Lipoprotein n=1 Tax=Enterococcus florum TaxID=2480627 RepID=A0A4P5P896_9ENTE|nr:hypothetical protein [Enterococcus florum]GCF92158.1 hypothetical protein NRIC_00490 [Enterococcus florum]
MKIFLLLASLLLLTACQGAEQATTTTTTSSSTEESISQTKASSQSSSSTDSSDTDTAMDELLAYYPKETFPLPNAVNSDNQLAMFATESNGVLTVFYYLVEEPVPLNDPRLVDKEPIAQFQRMILSSKEAAREEVAPAYDPSGEKIDLGSSITATQQKEEDSDYLNWKKNAWNFLIRSDEDQKELIPLAKEAAAFLEKVQLPVPHDVGQVTLRVNGFEYDRNMVVWQKDNVVYKTKNIEPMGSLRMAASMNR